MEALDGSFLETATGVEFGTGSLGRTHPEGAFPMSDPENTVRTSQVGNTVLISITGYYNEKVGEEVLRKGEEFLGRGLNKFVLDLTSCRLVNSPGIAALMALTLEIVESRKGKLVLVGCSTIMVKAFTLATIFPRADRADTVQAAMKDF